MAQFLRPDATITQSGFTGGFAEIDEATPSDADFAFGANNTAAVLEVALSSPAATPGSGTTTFRWRGLKVNNGSPDATGNSVTITPALVQGTTVLATGAAQGVSAPASFSFSPDTSGVTDWSDLRLRFTTSSSGGNPSNRRGGAVSWAELEVPDAAANNPTTIAVLAASVAVSGQAVGLNQQTRLGVLPASLASAGQALLVNARKSLNIIGGSVGYSGQSVNIGASSPTVLTVTAAALTTATQAVTLNVRKVLTAAAAGVLYSGAMVAVLRAKTVEVGGAAVTYIGRNVLVRLVGQSIKRRLQRLANTLGLGL